MINSKIIFIKNILKSIYKINKNESTQFYYVHECDGFKVDKVFAICLKTFCGTTSCKVFWKLWWPQRQEKSDFPWLLASKLPSVNELAPAKTILSLISFCNWKILSGPSRLAKSFNNLIEAALTTPFWCKHPLVAITAITLWGGRCSHITSKAALASARRNLFVSAVLWRRGPAISSSSYN